MQPVNLPDADKVFHAPEGVSADDCGDLSAKTGIDEGMTYLETVWTPTTKEELSALEVGCCLVIRVYGSQMPMMSVNVETPSETRLRFMKEKLNGCSSELMRLKEAYDDITRDISELEAKIMVEAKSRNAPPDDPFVTT